MSVELSIVIVNWNGINFLPDCLRSIVENPPAVSFEIVVVDNNSADKSVEWLSSAKARELLGDVKFVLIESAENLGYGKGNNLAFERTDSACVLILNPDTMVKKGSIDTLLETIKSGENIGMSAPKVFFPDGTRQSTVWRNPGAVRTLLEGFELYRLLPAKIRGEWLLSRYWSYDERKDVPLASGCGMMVSRKMIDDVGGFDTDIFMYGEDWEWCFRMNKAGWRIVFEPKAEIIHVGGQSSSQRWTYSEARVKEEEAFLQFQEKCFSDFAVARNTFARIISIYFRYVLRLVRKKETSFFDIILPLQWKGFNGAVHRMFSGK